MRRVLWMHANFVSGHQAGNTRPVHLVSAFLEAGLAVDVVCSSRSYLGDAERVTPGDVRVDREGDLALHRLGLQVARAGARARGKGAGYAAFVRAAARYARGLPRPDVIYCSSPPLPQVVAAHVVASRLRIPVVLELRDLWPAFLVDGGLVRSRALVAALHWLEALAYRSAHHVVAVVPGFTPYLAGMGVPDERLTVALSGADPRLREARRTREAVRAREGLADRFVVLYAGSFNRAYCVEQIVAAAEETSGRSPAVMWMLAGNGDQREVVERGAARLANLRYLGSLPKDEMAVYLGAADVGLNTHAPWPLLETEFSGKLFDYLAAGLPVVSTLNGHVERRLEQLGACRIAGPGAENLAAAVCGMAQLPRGRLEQMSRSAQEFAFPRLDSATMARQVARVTAASAASRGLSPGGWLCAGLGAFADVAAGRSRRVLAERYTGDACRRSVADAFSAWEAERDRWPSCSGPLHIPCLLSGGERAEARQ